MTQTTTADGRMSVADVAAALGVRDRAVYKYAIHGCPIGRGPSRRLVMLPRVYDSVGKPHFTAAGLRRFRREVAAALKAAGLKG